MHMYIRGMENGGGSEAFAIFSSYASLTANSCKYSTTLALLLVYYCSVA